MAMPLESTPVPIPALLKDVHYQDKTGAHEIATTLLDQFRADAKGDKYLPVFVNVGATSSTGDALGPFVGWFLKRKGFDGLYLGDLEAPCHAANLKEKLNEAWLMAMKQNKFPYIIAVDAAVGRPGRITVNRGPLKPGAGMGKTLPQVGSVHIMGGTAHFPFMIYFAALDQTVAMAEVIADGLMEFHALWKAEFTPVAQPVAQVAAAAGPVMEKPAKRRRSKKDAAMAKEVATR